MAIEKSSLKFFALRNKNGLEASFSNFGARWLSFVVPDRYGQFEDIVLGFDRIEQYLTAEDIPVSRRWAIDGSHSEWIIQARNERLPAFDQ